jgi:hypothetical protein
MKVYIGIAVSLLSLSVQAEEYVSPMEYKDYTCEELKEDYKGISDIEFNNYIESVDNFGTRKADELNEKSEHLKARLTAIEKAAKKINCEVSPKPNAESSVSSSSS